MPNSVTSIENATFRGCTGLKELTLPKRLKRIGYEAFGGCTGLTKLTLPKSVMHIDTFAFDGNGLEKITVESGNSCYDSRDNCNSIIETETNTLIIGCKNSIIPNSVTSIGKYAFYNCKGLTELTLPNSVTSIGEYAFDGTGLEKITVESENSCYDSRDNCNSIIETETNTLIIGCKNSIIPNSVTSIGEYAFHNCTGLAKLTLPNSLESIDDRAFEGCSGLTELTLPNSVTSIGEWAFCDCTGLTKLTLPNSLESIGIYAFRKCSGLTELTLPKKLKSIGNDAFQDCSGLTELTLPNTLEWIGESAFWGCTGLAKLTLPDSLESIVSGAFRGCTGLSKITSLAEIPPVFVRRVFDGEEFGEVNKANCELIVPEGSITAYKQAKGWNEFSSIRGFAGEKK